MSPTTPMAHLEEESPLIGPESTEADADVNNLNLSQSMTLSDSFVESKSSWYLFLLTLSIGGLQITWSVEISNGSPFLLSLGMSKSLLAIVWLAGPLSGVLVQPYVGIMSDNCRSPWGKRKPFIVLGALATIISLMGLAWTREIVLGIVGIFHGDKEGNVAHVMILSYATALMWILDFAINTMQAGIRAFIVDNAPAHQQEAANSWASRIVGVGNVLGYIFGYIDLPRYFPFLGDTQFKVLCVIAGISLVLTLGVSCTYIKERDPRLEGPGRWENRSPGLLTFFKEVFLSIRRMPPRIRKICEVQFFHWIGWFPFLFYITTYIGQLYANPHLEAGLTREELEKLWAEATRVGTFALVIYAITSLSANLLLPFAVVPSYKPETTHDIPTVTPTSPILASRHRSSSLSDHMPLNGSTTSLSIYSDLRPFPGRSTAVVSALSRALTRLQIPGLTLRRAWLLAQLLFSVCMFSTFFISTPMAATIMVAFVGISWSLTLWAPFALISAEVAKRDQAQRRRRASKRDDEDGEEEEDFDQAGVILGLHNVAISFPQVLATLMSSVVFHFLQKPRSIPGDTSVAWTMRIGGVAALAAAWVTSRLSDDVDD